MSCNLESFFTILRRYLIDDRTFLISFMDFVSLMVMMMLDHFEEKKKIVYEKYRSLDLHNKGLKEADIIRLLLSLDFHHAVKQK
mmetsp:Transcript_33773/g.32837  ORF Transcript_33773/g.32837 Transcript_33773/m.32837 type:complete len:84 (-) Transcript_33773:386-637(-)